jgi:hypothetical protein
MTIEDTARHGDDLVDPPDEEQPTREELIAIISEMEMDWRLLNVFLNRTADQYDWCSDYEERLRRYNEYFVVLSLFDRNSDKHDRGGSREANYMLSEKELEKARDRVRGLNERRNPPPPPPRPRPTADSMIRIGRARDAILRPYIPPNMATEELVSDGQSVGIFQQSSEPDWEIR